MKATTIDLRYRTHEVLKSLERGETVVITYRGKTKGTIYPTSAEEAGICEVKEVSKHPYFGSCPDDKRNVEDIMEDIRGGRCRDI